MVGQTRFAVGLFFSLYWARCCIQIPLESCPLLCPKLFFFYEFLFDEMICCAKAYKVQLGGDSVRGGCNVQKVLQRLATNILTSICCQNMWNNITILKDDMSKNSITGPWGGSKLSSVLFLKHDLTFNA